MKFKINKKVFEKFPGLVVAIPIVLDFDNSKSEEKSVMFLRGQEIKLRERFTLETFLKDKKVEVYNQAFRDFGVDPEKFLPAHVALSKRILEGGNLPDINPVVNIYNGMSIKHTTPFGGEDLNTLYGDFVLKFAVGGEKWIPIGGGKNKPAQKEELVWGDSYDLSTKALNWRQCDRTKLTSESKNGYFVMDGFNGVNRDVIEEASKEFVNLMGKYFGGKGKTYWLDKDNPEFEIPFKSKDVNTVAESVKNDQVKPKIKTEKKYFGIAKQIYESLRKITGVNDFNLEIPENTEFGDYSTNIAMTLKGTTLQGGPKKYAEILVEKLKEDKELSKTVDKIEVAGPGFINFYLSKQELFDILLTINSQIDIFGRNETKKGKKVVVEYTDPNPFKEFHIGHLISNVTGESFARLEDACGATVFRADYFGDVGVHVAKSIWGIQKKMKEEGVSLEDLSGQELTERIKFMGQGYAIGTRAFEENEKAKEEIGRLNTILYMTSQKMWKEKGKKSVINYNPDGKIKDSEISDIFDLYVGGREWSLAYFETIYARLGTKFDGYYPESVVGEVGYKYVKDNIGKVFEESEGAVIFRGEKFGLHTRVFINKHDLPTYEAKELGLAPSKYVDFKYDESIIVVGKEIKEYFAVLVEAMKQVNPKLGNVTTPICTGMVNLTEGKMSSRKGNVVTVIGLLDKLIEVIVARMEKHEYSESEKVEISESVAVGALKYAFLKNSVGQDFIFDLEKSLSLDGNSGPYIQYTYARTQSVLAKFAGSDPANQKSSESAVQGRTLQTEIELNNEESALIRTLIHFPETVLEAATNFAPNLLCNYIYDLSQKFNGFYNKHKILGSRAMGNRSLGSSQNKKTSAHSTNDLVPNFRIELTFATGQVLKNGLNLLGIQAPERM